MKDRFHLEDEITMLHSFAQQLETLSEGILEHDMSRDDIVTAIQGLKIMLDLHAQKIMDTMCQCLKLDQYNNTKAGAANDYYDDIYT